MIGNTDPIGSLVETKLPVKRDALIDIGITDILGGTAVTAEGPFGVCNCDLEP